ncbi:MAG: hypothetical protein ACP5O2_12010 [Bacteroidales bacterium]
MKEPVLQVLQWLADSAHLAMWVSDRHGSIIWISKATGDSFTAIQEAKGAEKDIVAHFQNEKKHSKRFSTACTQQNHW